jgi:hypothetical protein
MFLNESRVPDYSVNSLRTYLIRLLHVDLSSVVTTVDNNRPTLVLQRMKSFVHSNRPNYAEQQRYAF